MLFCLNRLFSDSAHCLDCTVLCLECAATFLSSVWVELRHRRSLRFVLSKRQKFTWQKRASVCVCACACRIVFNDFSKWRMRMASVELIFFFFVLWAHRFKPRFGTIVETWVVSVYLGIFWLGQSLAVICTGRRSVSSEICTLSRIFDKPADQFHRKVSGRATTSSAHFRPGHLTSDDSNNVQFRLALLLYEIRIFALHDFYFDFACWRFSLNWVLECASVSHFARVSLSTLLLTLLSSLQELRQDLWHFMRRYSICGGVDKSTFIEVATVPRKV